jgi:diguanylate cyclase (GGDEF)-like protein
MNGIIVVLLGLSALFTLPLAAVGVSRRRTPGARPFAVLVVAVGVWSALNAIQIVALDPATKTALARLAYVCIIAVVIAWWSTCVQYAGRADLSSRRHLALASIPGLISLMLVAAGSATTWMWTSLAVKAGPGPVALPRGPWFVVHSVWAFALVIGGLLVVARTMLRAPRAYRPQLIVLLVAVAVPLAVNAATVQSGLVDTRGHDLTPIATLVSAVVFGVGLLRFGLLDLAVGIVPIAHDTVVQSMRDGVLVVGPDGRILETNPASVALLNRAVPVQVGTAVVDVLPGWAPLATSFEVQHDSSGSIVEVSSSAIDDNRGYVITLRDVTDARASEGRLRQSFELASYQAHHDHLTGLPNRRHLFDVLREQLGTYALLIVDLDGFKSVNDSHGHGAGDEVLSQLARRLRSGCRPEAVVARLGGDEFAVLLPGVTDADAELAARVAIGALSAPVIADGHEIALTASVGIAVAPRHGTNSDELVRAADIAMYAAKRSHVRVAVYGVGDDARSPDRVLLVQELRRAIGAGEIICHYQPQVLPNGVVQGV